jgi:hypothetical protein
MYVGWIPLAPWEPYYCSRYWGPSSVVVNNINIYNINVDHDGHDKHGKHNKHNGHHENSDHAIIVKQSQLYTVTNYNAVKVKDIHRADIIKNAKAIPVLSEKIIRDYPALKQKYNFTDARVAWKPHESVTERIAKKQERARQTHRDNGKAITQQLSTIRKADPASGADIKPPQITRKTMHTDEIKKPGNVSDIREGQVKKQVSEPGGEVEHVRQKGRFIVIPSPKPAQGPAQEEARERPAGIHTGREEIQRPRPLPTQPRQEHPAGNTITHGPDQRIRQLPKPPQHEQTIQPGTHRQIETYQRTAPRPVPSQGSSTKESTDSGRSMHGDREFKLVPREAAPHVEQYPTSKPPAQTAPRTQPQQMPQSRYR